MCYHQFLTQVDEQERSGKLIEAAPCPYCDPRGYAQWKRAERQRLEDNEDARKPVK